MVNATLRISNARTDAVLRVQKRLPLLGDVVHLRKVLLDRDCRGRAEPPVQHLGGAGAAAKGLEGRVFLKQFIIAARAMSSHGSTIADRKRPQK